MPVSRRLLLSVPDRWGHTDVGVQIYARSYSCHKGQPRPSCHRRRAALTARYVADTEAD